jgi:hypothetical protein
VFTIYDGTLIQDRICVPENGPQPIAPQPIEQWITEDNDDEQPIAVITTSVIAGNYVHDVKLKDVILTNSVTGEKIKLSDIAEKDAEGYYYFGRYQS